MDRQLIVPPEELAESNLLEGKNVFHIPSYFSTGMCKRWLEYLEKLDFAPLEHKGLVARFEADVCQTFELSKPFIRNAEEITRMVSLESLCPEFYAFRYQRGHSVPWHKDRKRHKITLMAYFGEFSGGAYEYKDLYDNSVLIKPACGDVILVINETCTGKEINPSHCVHEVVEGTRFTIVVSMVSTKDLTEPFGS